MNRLKASGSSFPVLPLQADSTPPRNSSESTSPFLSKSAISAILFQRFVITSLFFAKLSGFQDPFPSISVFLTARHSKSSLSSTPLLSTSYMYLTMNFTRLLQLLTDMSDCTGELPDCTGELTATEWLPM